MIGDGTMDDLIGEVSDPLVREALRRQDKAIRTLAWWLVQAQTGLGERDARGIDRILDVREQPQP